MSCRLSEAIRSRIEFLDGIIDNGNRGYIDHANWQMWRSERESLLRILRLASDSSTIDRTQNKGADNGSNDGCGSDYMLPSQYWDGPV
jgi:hypothetical protein